MKTAGQTLDRAIDLDPLLPVAHVQKGWYFLYRGDSAAADAAARRSLPLQPGFWRAVWAVGAFETIMHWTGSTWSTVTTKTGTGNLTGVWGTGPGDIWAVGNAGLILRGP